MASFEYVGSELEVFALAINWKRYFADLTRPYVQGRVLEVGAGIGETTRALLSPAVTRWVCVEPDARLVGRLHHLRRELGTTLEVVNGDITAVARGEHFDTILYIDVLEHIRDDSAELQFASALLAPGGHLVVLSPACMMLYSPFDRALGHERRYSRRTLEAAFPATLTPVRTFYADSAGVLLSLANRILLRQSLPTQTQIRFWDRRVISISRVLDPLIGRRFGRSIIAVYRAPAVA